MKFEVGDFIFGTSDVYLYTGKGSISVVLETKEDSEGTIRVRLVAPFWPYGQERGKIYWVNAKHFKPVSKDLQVLLQLRYGSKVLEE